MYKSSRSDGKRAKNGKIVWHLVSGYWPEMPVFILASHRIPHGGFMRAYDSRLSKHRLSWQRGVGSGTKEGFASNEIGN